MKSVHNDTAKPERKEAAKKEGFRSRSLKSGYPVFKDHKFNLEPPPWGYNWFLGYCEQPQTFNG